MIRMRVLLLIAVLTAGSGCIVPRADPASGALGSAMERALTSGTATFDHSVWGGLLHEGTEGGLVDYKIMQSHRQELNAYVESIAQVQLDRLERNELKALLINAYNAFTVVAILNNSGVASIRDIDGVWTSLTWDIGGSRSTISNITYFGLFLRILESTSLSTAHRIHVRHYLGGPTRVINLRTN